MDPNVWWKLVTGRATEVTAEEVRAAINAASIEDQRVPGLCAVCGSYTYEPICPPCERTVLVHGRYGAA